MRTLRHIGYKSTAALEPGTGAAHEVFVHVRAEGGTRVLRFADTKDPVLETVEDNLQVWGSGWVG